MHTPTEYLDGFEKAKSIDPVRAVNYIEHTHFGDPVADEMVADLSLISKEDSKKWVELILTGRNPEEMTCAPASVQRFNITCTTPPDWLNPSLFAAGNRMFFRNARLILAAFTGGVLIEGFSTTIARSFFLTGRLRDQGVRRLKQNNRHLLEIFTPGGLETYHDGWSLSVRIRLVHARVRFLLEHSGEWDTEAVGKPINAAQLGFALSAFSARTLYHLRRLGGQINREEREGFMAVWRYSGHLMGIPDTILLNDEADAVELFRIGGLCEPPPSFESIALAASLLNSAPLLVGLTEAGDRQKLADYITGVSRAIIGNSLADQLMYPEGRSFGTLLKFRMVNRLSKIFQLLRPGSSVELENFMTMMDVSQFDNDGVSSNFPDHYYSEQSSQW